MHKRPFLPALLAAAAGLFRDSSQPSHTLPITAATDGFDRKDKIWAGICQGNSGASHRWRQKLSRPHGRRGMRNGTPSRQILTNPKFMHRSQRVRFAKGETIFA